MAAESRHVLLIGLQVTDEVGYRSYRSGMTPILKRHGGDFGYDFVVCDVLKSEAPAAINRVFTIVFPDAATAKRFFSNEEYLAIRKRYFEPSVAHTTRLAVFDEPAREPG